MKRAIFGSLLLHALLLWLAAARRDGAVPSPTPALQVRTLNEKQLSQELRAALERTERQIVQSDDQLRDDSAPETRQGKQFLSKNNQRVDAETRAPRVGRFKNALHEGLTAPSPAPDRAPAPTSNVSQLFRLAEGPRPAAPPERATGRLRAPASVETTAFDAQSATDDYLKDIAIGANTLLNTREFKFYAFYERIREKISDRWHQNLEQAFAVAQDRIHDPEQTTIIQVSLDALGQLQGVKVLLSSGVSELDHAATDAFRQASPFPNPPAAMLDAHHSVVLRWDFVVVADGGGAVQVRVRRAAF